MGLFSKLINTIVKDENVQDKVRQATDWVVDQLEEGTKAINTSIPSATSKGDNEWLACAYRRDKAYFRTIFKEEFPEFMIEENVSADSMGWERSREYRDRKGEYPCLNFDFVLTKEGHAPIVVMVTEPNRGTQAVFKNTKDTAKKNHGSFVNFFVQFPSPREYVVDRIKAVL